MSYKLFKEEFDKDYKDIYDFMDKTYNCSRDLPYNGTLEADLDEEDYDSYGSEDSRLGKVVYFKDFDVLVKFTGTRQSYQGEEWDHMNETKKVEKSIFTYE